MGGKVRKESKRNGESETAGQRLVVTGIDR